MGIPVNLINQSGDMNLSLMIKISSTQRYLDLVERLA